MSFVEPYAPDGDDSGDAQPARRRLRIFALDPALPKSVGGVVTVEVPYEPIERTPAGKLQGQVFRFEAHPTTGHPPKDFGSAGCALTDGFAPQTGSYAFSCQMAYAVAMQVYEQFRIALGRAPRIPFRDMLKLHDSGGSRGQPETAAEPLWLRPDLGKDKDGRDFVNACYDSEEAEIRFGAFDARDTLGAGSCFRVQTALSADIVAHEVVHALVDGEKPMLLAASAESVAFHEGFADLIALFLHFLHRDYLADAIERHGGDLDDVLLVGLAGEFGRSLDRSADALRSVLAGDANLDQPPPADRTFNILYEPHALGAVLSAAVFGAFRIVYRRKSGLLRRLSPEEMSRAKAELFAARVQELAQDFLSMLIRALDYLPPAQVTFSDFLRAVLTADMELVVEDSWGYRDALVDSFRRFGIPFHGLLSYSPTSLRWKSFSTAVAASFGQLDVRRINPGAIGANGVLNTLIAEAVRTWLCGKEDVQWRKLGLCRQAAEAAQSTALVIGAAFARRSARGGGMVEEFVVQVVQSETSGNGHVLDGGTTLIFDPRGRLKYAIAAPVDAAFDQQTLASSEPLNYGGARHASFDHGVPLRELQLRFLYGVGAEYRDAFSRKSPGQASASLAERARAVKRAMFALKHHHFDHWSEPAVLGDRRGGAR